MSPSTLVPEAAVSAPHCTDTLVPGADNSRRATARVLAGLRRRFLLECQEIPDVDLIFDDLESVLGEYAGELTAAEIVAIRPRLHAAYRQIAFVSRNPRSGVAPELVAASRALLTERFPAAFPAALGHLRRLAVTVSDLLDVLLEDLP